MLNLPNAIVWIQLRLVGLTMLSSAQLLALSRPNLSAMRLEIVILDELHATHTC